MQFTWLSMRPSASSGCCFGRSGRWYPATALSLQAGPQACLHPPHYNLASVALGAPGSTSTLLISLDLSCDSPHSTPGMGL